MVICLYTPHGQAAPGSPSNNMIAIDQSMQERPAQADQAENQLLGKLYHLLSEEAPGSQVPLTKG